MSDRFDPKRFAWARSHFDTEGLVGALAAFVIGVLLGMLWSPLFWLGAISTVLILLATRRANRSGPSEASAVVAPVDGVVVTVESADPPSELRYGASEATRIRIASSPASQNRVFAPLSGSVKTVITESGTESQPIAMDADAHGLFNAFITLEGHVGETGLRLVTGGLGPRVDIDVVAGDTVDAGGLLGKRRLGGWCDVYLPGGAAVLVTPGMTLVGGETRLVSGDGRGASTAAPMDEVETVRSDPAVAPEPVVTPAETTAQAPETEPDPAEASEIDTLTEDDGKDPAEMFAKLRSRVEDAANKDPS